MESTTCILCGNPSATWEPATHPTLNVHPGLRYVYCATCRSDGRPYGLHPVMIPTIERWSSEKKTKLAGFVRRWQPSPDYPQLTAPVIVSDGLEIIVDRAPTEEEENEKYAAPMDDGTQAKYITWTGREAVTRAKSSGPRMRWLKPMDRIQPITVEDARKFIEENPAREHEIMLAEETEPRAKRLPDLPEPTRVIP